MPSAGAGAGAGGAGAAREAVGSALSGARAFAAVRRGRGG